MRKAASALLAGGVRLLSSRSGGICQKTSGQYTLGQSLQGSHSCSSLGGWHRSFNSLKGVWERCQHATQQTHGLLRRGELHETLQKLQGTRRLSSTGAAGAQQAGKQATQTAQQAVRSAHAGGKGAASAAYRSLPQQARKLLDSALQPGAAQKALSMHVESFWQRHGNKVLGLGAALLLYVLWKTMFGMASVFVNLSETMAGFGFLALSAAIVAFAGLYLRSRYSIRPDAVYRKALVQLNTSPAILEVMGPPIAGSDLRAQILTGGGLRLKNLQPRIRSRRLQMLFWATGTERRGLVSLEAKKQKGRYVFKLLAVDVPSAAGPEQRIYLEGDQRTYNRGAVLREMRDPLLNALAMQDAYEAEDEIDDAADDAAEAQQRRSRAAAVASGSQLPDNSAYFHERLYWGLRRWFSRMWDSSREGEGQKASTAIAPVPSAGSSPAAKSAATVETGKSQTAPAA